MVVEGVKPALVSLYDYYDTKEKWVFHRQLYLVDNILDESHNQHEFRAEVLYTLEKEEEEEAYIYREASTNDTYVSYEDYYTK